MRLIYLALAALGAVSAATVASTVVVAETENEDTQRAQIVQTSGIGSDKTITGWTRTTIIGVDHAWQRGDGRLLHASVNEADLKQAVINALRRDDFRNESVEGQAPVNLAAKLDTGGGKGAALVGTATRGGKPYRFAATVLYGTLDDSPRKSTVYLFAAPDTMFRNHGGWAAVGQAWYTVDGSKVRHLLLRSGQMPAQRQADYLAHVADTFIQNTFFSSTNANPAMAQNMINTTNQFLADICFGDEGGGGITATGISGC